MFLRRLILSLFLIALLIGGAIAIAGWLHHTKPDAEHAADPPPPPMVTVQAVAPEDILERFTGYGTARADRHVILAAEVVGVVTDVAREIEDGSIVEEDQVLVRIDDRRYRQQLIRAEAAAASLQAQVDQLDVEKSNIEKLAAITGRELDVNREEMRRLGELFEEDNANKREYDFARLSYEQARRTHQEFRNRLALIEPRRGSLEATRDTRLADAELARLDVERCAITAPFAGQIETLSVDVGDHLLPGGEVLRLMATDRIEVPIELAASVRPFVQLGANCQLDVDSMPNIHWDGALARIAPAADPNSRTFAAYIEVVNTVQSTPLIPGHFLTAKVDGPVWRQAMATPRGAIVNGHVYVANDEHARARAVHVTRYVEGRALITGDVHAGDRVILTNLDVLFDGALVRIASDTPVTPAVVAGGEK